MAVGITILNRVNNKNFPNSICKVVNQKTRKRNRIVCEFSYECDGLPEIIRDMDSWNIATAAASQVLHSYLYFKVLLGLEKVLYYHADYVNPEWPYKKVIQIGNHIFYKE